MRLEKSPSSYGGVRGYYSIRGAITVNVGGNWMTREKRGTIACWSRKDGLFVEADIYGIMRYVKDVAACS